MSVAKKMMFTGGGTVGHVTLNLLLIPYFIKDGWEIHYIGAQNGIEQEQIQKSGLPVTFHAIATGKLRRYFSWQNFADVFKVVCGILQSLVILARVRPQALFSKGGFVSVPPVIAAKMLGVRVFVHESDLSMGLANKIAYRFATTMYSTFQQPSQLTKVKHVGAITKVREGAVDPSLLPQIEEIKAQFDRSLPTLLFIGGSAGAKVFNEFISKTSDLLEHYNVINITGDADLKGLSRHLYRIDYVIDLYYPLMDLADIVITRGGSNTIFELVAMAKPHLIVPLGREASRGDQLENAAYFEKQGYAVTLSEEDLTFAHLQAKLKHLLHNQRSYQDNMQHSKELTSPEKFYNLLKNDLSSKPKEN
nr:UDP-N-acetylglucosamine--N-acetylmuramyl-(pentapeptide) pyrophosphoryl-undecaprenol N-acetylglucosamine transferase [Streptococcus halichoeri]